MSKILLITPPDRIQSLDQSYLLICPSTTAKTEFQEILRHGRDSVKVYLYEETDDDLDWLLTVFQEADAVYLELDNCPKDVRDLAAFFIAHSKTSWMSKGDYEAYNKISIGRTYDMSWAQSIIEEEDYE